MILSRWIFRMINELLIVLRFDFDSSFEFVMVRILTSDCNP